MSSTNALAAQLSAAQIPFLDNVIIDGLVVDYLVETPSQGAWVIIEWSGDRGEGYTSHAAVQVAQYRALEGVDQAWLVFKEKVPNRLDQGIVTMQKLLDLLKTEFRQADHRPTLETRHEWRRLEKSEPFIFAVMPFKQEYENTFFGGMVAAAREVNLVCLREDQLTHTGDIIKKIKQMLRRCAVVVADVSESNPNVLYEVGYAHGLHKPVIQICATPLKDLPFMIRNNATIKYELTKMEQLKADLIRHFREAMKHKTA